MFIRSLARTSSVKPIKIAKDENMSENRQNILNHFKQGHLLEVYERLSLTQRDQFVEQLEMIHFDVIDLVKIAH